MTTGQRARSIIDRLAEVTETMPMPLVPLLFILLGFGYMLLWTAIGSRIKDLLVDYGPSFFTEINVIFYIMGLPTSLFQKRYDHRFDSRYRSKITFRCRVYTGLVFLIMICLILPIANYTTFLIMTFFMSILTWTIHNTVCKLANIVGYRTAAYQQIGFVLPGVVCLLLTYLLPKISDNDNSGGKRKTNATPDYTNSKKWTFYGIIAGIILLSLFGSIILLKMRIIKSKLGKRDTEIGSISDTIPQRSDKHIIVNPIIDKQINMEMVIENGMVEKEASQNEDIRDSSQSQQSEDDDDIGSILETAYTDYLEHEITFKDLASESQDSEADDKKDKNLLSQSMISDSPITGTKIKGDDASSLCGENYYHTVQLYLMSLFIALYCSILEASFISFVHTASGRGGDGIVTVLYFVRIFSDLLGRPLTFLASYLYLDNIENIFYLALFRVLLLILFFLYVFAPLHWNMDNNAFIIILQGFISLSSGFIVVSVYELASKLFKAESLRNKCVDDLNIAFQAASAAAAITGLIILASIGVF